jgi:glycine cleavage system aminomethyltransferase T
MDRWEFFTTSDQGLQLWDVLFEAGLQYQLIAIGDRALEGLRIESLSLRNGKDFWSEHDPYEVGLGYLVDLNKPAFIGKEALIERKTKGPKLTLTTLILNDPSMVVMGYEPVFNEGNAVGFVTSAGYAYSSGKGIGYALLSPEVVKTENEFSIEYFGQHYTAKIMTKSPVITF